MTALQGGVESGAPVCPAAEQAVLRRADFRVPYRTGKKEWRFTPLRRLRGDTVLRECKVTVPAEAVASRPTVISVRGEDAAGAAFGHTLVELEPARQRGGHARSPRQRATRPGELAIDGGTQSRCYTAAQARGSRVPSMAARATSVRRRLLLRA